MLWCFMSRDIYLDVDARAVYDYLHDRFKELDCCNFCFKSRSVAHNIGQSCSWVGKACRKLCDVGLLKVEARSKSRTLWRTNFKSAFYL